MTNPNTLPIIFTVLGILLIAWIIVKSMHSRAEEKPAQLKGAGIDNIVGFYVRNSSDIYFINKYWSDQKNTQVFGLFKLEYKHKYKMDCEYTRIGTEFKSAWEAKRALYHQFGIYDSMTWTKNLDCFPVYARIVERGFTKVIHVFNMHFVKMNLKDVPKGAVLDDELTRLFKAIYGKQSVQNSVFMGA